MPFEFQVGERPGPRYRAMRRFHITEEASGTLLPSLARAAFGAGVSLRTARLLPFEALWSLRGGTIGDWPGQPLIYYVI